MELIKSLFLKDEIINIRSIENKKKDPHIINYHIKNDNNIESEILKHIEKDNQKYNIYFGVNPRQGAHNSHVSRIACLFIDIDSKDFTTQEDFEVHIKTFYENLKEKKLIPNFEVSSGHGVHYYWLLDPKEKKEILWVDKKKKGKIEKVQKCKFFNEIEEALIFHGKADNSVKDLARILRMPGTKNIKDPENQIDVTEKNNGKKPYKMKQFSEMVKAHKEEKKKIYEAHKKKQQEKKQVEKAHDEYEKNSQSIEEENIKEIILEVLAKTEDFPTKYKEMLDLGMAFKSEGLEYSEVDKVFKNKFPGYSYQASEEKYNEIVPEPHTITFGTAFYYAKKHNPIMLKNLLKKAPRKEKDNTTQFKEEGNKVFYFIEEKNRIIKKEATNFLMRITKKIKNDENESSFELKIKSDNETSIFEMDGGGFPVLGDFRKDLGKQGLYLLSIKDIEIYNQYLQFVNNKSNAEQVKKTNFLGRVASHVFLMENCIITKNGKEELSTLRPDISKSQKKKMEYKKEKDLDLGKFIKDMNIILGEQTYKFIGFLVASLYSNYIYNHMNFFPLLFFYGQSESGKSTIANFGQACFGTQNITPPFTINSTSKSIQRTMSRFYNTPVQYNEYKPSEKTNNLLISIFDREAYSRAVKDNTNKTITTEVNATMLFLGTYGIAGYKAEDLTNRTVEVNFNYAKRDNSTKEIIDYWEENINNLIGFIEHCFQNIKAKSLVKEIKSTIKNAKKQYGTRGRVLENHCIFQAAYNQILESLNFLESYGVANIKEDIERQQSATQNNQVAEPVLNIIENIYTKKDVLDNRIIKENGCLYFDLKNLYINILQEARKAGIDLPDKRTLATSLKIKGIKQKSKRIGDKVKKYWVYRTDIEFTEKEEWYNEYDRKNDKILI